MRRPLFLSGMMGVGKSVLGRRVAERLGVPFVDLDQAIEARTGHSPAQLFEGPAGEGERLFRRLEAEELQEVLTKHSGPAVIALGGGTLTNEQSLRLVLERGFLVGLRARPETLAARLFPERHARPLIARAASEAELSELVRGLGEARASSYGRADVELCTDGRTVEQLCEALAEMWRGWMHTVRVNLSEQSYGIQITRNAARFLAEQLGVRVPTSVFLVSDAKIFGMWGSSLSEALEQHGHRVVRIQAEAGEGAKTWEEAGRLLSALLEAGADRSSVLLALGGGAVCDVTGFAASLLHRGIRWMAVPTTLLSMVDASIGGKTAVNVGLVKNAAGRIHQPSGVVIAPTMTATEDERAFRSGLAEVVKVALMLNARLWTWLESEHASICMRDTEALGRLIFEAAAAKAGVVERDELEHGERVVLNFGHTVGHALEAEGGFARWTHGEAVALGMVVEARVGAALSLTEPAVVERLIQRLTRMGLPVQVEPDELTRALARIRSDKKRRGDRLSTAFPRALGEASRVTLDVGAFCAEALKTAK